MMIQLQMGQGYPQTVAEISKMGAAVRKACSKGLGKGVKIAAGRVISEYLTGQSLKHRTGNLARAVQGWMADDLEGVVGVQPNSAVEKYKWLLGDQSIPTIKPKHGKYLTIPIGEALTGAGVLKAKYSEGLRNITGGFFVKTKRGKLLFGYKRGKRGKFRALFVLKKSVFVQPTGALYDGVIDSEDAMTGAIQTEVDKVISD